MKDPKEIKSFSELPQSFREPIEERIGSIEALQSMNREDIVKEVIAWFLGDSGWYDQIDSWLNDAGLEIRER